MALFQVSAEYAAVVFFGVFAVNGAMAFGSGTERAVEGGATCFIPKRRKDFCRGLRTSAIQMNSDVGIPRCMLLLQSIPDCRHYEHSVLRVVRSATLIF